jgi:hypothetical protein
MTTTYEVRAIEPEVLAQLRERDDAGRAPRESVDADGGAPLRCCLRPSEPGERLALVAYAPVRRWAAQQGIDPGPYDELGPIFIHAEPCAGPGAPDRLHQRDRVLRGYTSAGTIHGGLLAESGEVAAGLDKLLADSAVAVVHVRAVEFGCFLYEVRRS